MKQIIIFSQDGDVSTTKIMRWLTYYEYKVIRINIEDSNFKVISIGTSTKIETTYGIYEIKAKDVVWFRRVTLVSVLIPHLENLSIEESCFYEDEKREMLYALYHWIMDNCSYIANPFTSDPSKLHELEMAKNCGILTPETVVSTCKEDIVKMLKKYPKLAVKPFTGLMTFSEENTSKTLTTLLQQDDLDKIPEEFGGLIIQNYIEKKYELRTFFFEKEFYTMAIFSQNDDKTQIDFRNYNREKPNKRVCYELPTYYKEKLLQIAQKLGLDSGSFDIIVDKNDNYYFLEVNPIGQFGMVSYPCNYNIEEKIALALIKKSQTNE